MPKDRTSEFHSTLASIRSRQSIPGPPSSSSSLSSSSAITNKQANRESKQPLLLPDGPHVIRAPGATGGKIGGGPGGGGGEKKLSEFGRMAGGIAKDINATTAKLGKLAQLAKRKTLFDDRPIEISELTYIIRQDIAHLNTSIAALQSYVRDQKSRTSGSGSSKDKSRGGEGKVVEEHNSNVVMMLQSRLAVMGMGFKDVLELRTQNMKASKDRTEQFMHTASQQALPAPANNSLLFNQPSRPPSTPGFPPDRPSSSSSSSQLKGKARAIPGQNQNALDNNQYPGVSGHNTLAGENDFLALDIDGDRGESGIMAKGSGSAGEGYQQMQLVEQQDNYIQSRSTAIESIESTIAELGQIFTQLAGMVAEQRETVQRIDADTTDIAANVSGAQRELLKYYASVTSNRWLMLKIFGVLIIFFLVFILVS